MKRFRSQDWRVRHFIMSFSSSGWIIRKFSGQQAISINITTILLIWFSKGWSQRCRFEMARIWKFLPGSFIFLSIELFIIESLQFILDSYFLKTSHSLLHKLFFEIYISQYKKSDMECQCMLQRNTKIFIIYVIL